jgi:hypothetical protein
VLCAVRDMGARTVPTFSIPGRSSVLGYVRYRTYLRMEFAYHAGLAHYLARSSIHLALHFDFELNLCRDTPI